MDRFVPKQRTDYVALLNEWAVGFYTELPPGAVGNSSFFFASRCSSSEGAGPNSSLSRQFFSRGYPNRQQTQNPGLRGQFRLVGLNLPPDEFFQQTFSRPKDLVKSQVSRLKLEGCPAISPRLALTRFVVVPTDQ